MSSPPAAVEPVRSDPGAGRATTRRALTLGLLGLATLLVTVSALSIVLGAASTELGDVLGALTDYDASNSDHEVVAGRLPRLLAGILVGAALGLAGAIMQGVTRNPLADPGLLGVNAGAAFAVVTAISWLGISAPAGYVWFAFAGAAVAAAVVYGVGSLGRDGATPVKLALAGAAMSAVLTAITTAVLLTDTVSLDQYRFWTVGSLSARPADLIASLAPFVVVGAALGLCTGRTLNALSLGDDLARGLGQRVGPARALAATAAVILCGAATAIAGPIWFVGLLVPHLARVFTGPDYRWILPYSMVLAPTLLLVADVAGRVVARPGELQVGIVLSFVGAPVLIALVRRSRLAGL